MVGIYLYGFTLRRGCNHVIDIPTISDTFFQASVSQEIEQWRIMQLRETRDRSY